MIDTEYRIRCDGLSPHHSIKILGVLKAHWNRSPKNVSNYFQILESTKKFCGKKIFFEIFFDLENRISNESYLYPIFKDIIQKKGSKPSIIFEHSTEYLFEQIVFSVWKICLMSRKIKIQTSNVFS